jgi:hypothetical protein
MLTQTAAAGEGADAMDMKLEVVTIPVSDVSRAREFYASLGWRPDWYAEYMVAEQAGTELPT